MWSLRYLRWLLIRFLCQRLYVRLSIRPVLTEWDDPIETFKEVRTPVTWGRFVAYVVWLKQFPTAAEWFFKIEEQFPEQVPSCFPLLCQWLSTR